VSEATGIAWTVASPGLAEAVLRDSLEAFAYVRLRVTGDCMTPVLVPGDVVLIAGVATRPPRLRDVVLVWAPAGPLLHRLVWGPPLARGTWRTKADRSALWDARVAPRDVLGTIIAVERAGSATPLALTGGLGASLSSLLGGVLFLGREKLLKRGRWNPSH
jgi:hypothetical protein